MRIERTIMGTSNKTPPPGQILFTASSYFLVPANVTSICGLCIGGGGNGCAGNYFVSPDGTGYGSPGASGGGGALAYVNNIPVTPGEYLTITVGGVAGSSYILRGGSVLVGAGGGYNATPATYPAAASPGAGGSVLVGTGGAGGAGLTGGGGAGGAGGYSGAGGAAGYSGAGGGGGGGGQGGSFSSGSNPFLLIYYGGGGGGGVGVLGEGASGSAGSSNASGYGNPGFGGSGGAAGSISSGGHYGGGGAGGSSFFVLYTPPAGSTVTNFAGASGASGAVRIIWGAGRAFPSTNTGNV